MSKNKTLKFSKYNNLSEIYKFPNNKKVIKKIPSPNLYYNAKYDIFRPIIHKNDGKFTNYSVLGLDNNNNKARLIKFETGVIALKIPYLKLITLYKEEEEEEEE